jgi:hypothetical protein
LKQKFSFFIFSLCFDAGRWIVRGNVLERCVVIENLISFLWGVRETFIKIDGNPEIQNLNSPHHPRKI